jgi:hypothetical protein
MPQFWEVDQYADLACKCMAAFALFSLGIFLLYQVVK